MPNLLLDDKLSRVEMRGFAFPLGVYPIEPADPRAGYVLEFEPADGATSFPDATGTPGAEEEWEEWPDRFMFDVLVPAGRLRSLCLMLFSLLPRRVYPILDVLGRDAYREIDPYIAYDQVGIDRLFEGLGMFGQWLLEDGMVGFGAMSLEPFLYIFIDEHKIVTVRAELSMKERVERVLGAFDLGEVPALSGADSVEHEHRTVLADPSRHSEAVRAEEIIDYLRESWRLQLNIDPTSNVDDEGKPLGLTWWDCLARCMTDGEPRHAEVLLAASNLEEAERMVTDTLFSEASGEDGWADIILLRSDRVTDETMRELSGGRAGGAPPDAARIVSKRFLD